jgi:magnesium transporter
MRPPDAKKRERPTLPPAAAPPEPLGSMKIFAYSADALEERELHHPKEILELAQRWPTTWVNVDGPLSPPLLQSFQEELGLHPLALEDVMTARQRPKVETYSDHLFIVVRMLQRVGEVLETEQLAIFLFKNCVVTFQGDRPGDCLEGLRGRLRTGRSQARQGGADHLAYEIVDAVIDHYFPICHDLDDRLERLEDEIVHNLPKHAPEQVLGAKHDVLMLRRIIGPTRDLVTVLQRNDLKLFAPETLPYLRDCYDHANRLLDTVDTQREVSSTLMDLYLSLSTDRTNSVMRFLTLISTIFIPLTFIAGVYGMNFDPDVSPWNMPELRWAYGYPFSLGLMAALALLMAGFFYLRGWLERPKR